MMGKTFSNHLQWLITACILLFCQIADAQIIDNEFLIRCKPGANIDRVAREIVGTSSRNLPTHSLSSTYANIHLLRFDSASTWSAEELASHPDILAVQRNCRLNPRNSDANDPLFDEQWSLPLVGAPQVWNDLIGGTTHQGDSIVVMLLESGFDVAHEDLQNILWTNKGEIPDNGIDDDGNGFVDDYRGVNLDMGGDDHQPDTTEHHGTSVVGVIAATRDNALGIAGISSHVKIMLLTSYDVDFDKAVKAFSYAIEMRKLYNETNGEEGAFVVATNTSFGRESEFEQDAPIFCDMYNLMGEQGIVSVGAAENDQGNADLFGDLPSNCSSPYLIVATSIDRDERLAVAGFGKTTVDLGAPGEAIWSTKIGTEYELFSGTSYASPLVCGAIALLYTHPSEAWVDAYRNEPSATALMIKNLILSNVVPIADLMDRTVTGGRLDLMSTLNALRQAYPSNVVSQTIHAFPNPVLQSTWITFPDPMQGFRVSVVNTAGLTVLDQHVSALVSQYQFRVDGWSAGTYFFRIVHPSGVWSGRMVKY